MYRGLVVLLFSIAAGFFGSFNTASKKDKEKNIPLHSLPDDDLKKNLKCKMITTSEILSLFY